MTRRRLSAWILAAFLVAGSWLLLAPPALGGETSYVVTSGVSMQPRFHTGDLALVRTQGSYAIGDIVAYRSPTLGVVVLHRIHSGNSRGFRTQGDNNTWLDPDAVPADQVLGKLWVHVPGVGAFMHAGTLVPAAVVLGAGAVAVPVRSRRRPRGRASRRKASPVQGTSKRSAASVWLVAATVAGVGGAGLVVLAARASAPVSTPAAVVTHALELTYQAPADRAVYQGGTLVTGDPVFLKLNSWIDVALRDQVSGESTATARTLGLQARLTGAGSWQYTVPLDGQASSHGADSDLQVHLDLRSLQSIVTQAATHTGAAAGSYQLQLLPTVRTTPPGETAPAPVTFPPVVFQVQGGQLVLVGAGAQRGVAVSRSATEPVPAGAAHAGPARQVHVAGTSLSAALVTTLGIGALVAGAVLGAVGLLRQRRDPLAGLTQPLITVAARDLGAKTVMTASVDELFELARRYNRPVLHMVVAGRPTYAVEEGGTWYGCYLGRGAGDPAATDPGDADTQRMDLLEGFPPPPPRPGTAESSLDLV